MEKWKNYLLNSQVKNYNVEHLKSMKQNSCKLVYKYVMRSLEILDKKNVNKSIYYYISETLKWMDVAKTGTKKDRKKWKDKGYNLHIHNIASAQIYKDEADEYNEIIYILIKTHGIIGQYIRGETRLTTNYELYQLIEKKLIEKEVLKEILIVLNEAIIGAVSYDIYNKIKSEIEKTINNIVSNQFEHELNYFQRMIKLNNGLSIDKQLELNSILKNNEIKERIIKLFNQVDLWYYEVAISNYSIKEQIKILLICCNNISNITNLTFEKIMKSTYLDFKEKKVVNLFKKRIVEEYLKSLSIKDILRNNLPYSPHISFKLSKKGDTLLFDFHFSIQAIKLIEFCMVAINSDSLYKKAIYMLYDLFGFRKDKYDRFYNEIDYLNTMNSSLKHKAELLNYIVGKNILDVGPGGGALINLIEDKYPSLNVYGIDISANVIDELKEIKQRENRNWHLIKGDALQLNKYLKKGSIDTIIFSSILHELYSYIDFEGIKFNINTVITALKSAYELLPKGGRIIIRDGIKTEPVQDYRIIQFKNTDDIKILDRYCGDFKGRCITYQKIDNDKVCMLVNDAMEFLYTYTWGEESYPHEVNEQFGYLTPSEYIDLIKNNLLGSKIITCKSFLQEGYEENLLNKISIYDKDMNHVKLPNSTCIIVIEKTI